MSEHALYGAASDSAETAKPRTKVRTLTLQKWKSEGHKWAMLTCYDYSSARVFDDAGIPVLLVGDSAANVVYGYDTTVPITIDELIPLVRAVVKGAPHALVVADLPFGSYESSPTQALATATQFMKETGAQAVKLEGGERMADQIAALSAAGIPVVAHIGFTRRASTAWAGSGCRAGATPPSRPSTTPSPYRKPARSRSCLRWCPPSWQLRSPASSPSPPSASVRAPTVTPRCWSGRTWPG